MRSVRKVSERKASWVAGFALAAGFGLTAPSMAAAALDPVDQCEVSKVKASGKYSQCVANVNAKGIAGATAADVDKLAKCDEKIGGGFTKAEDKAAGACLVTGDESNINSIVDGCMADIITALGGVPGGGGDQAKCQSNKLKTAGKYSACRFKALAKSIKDAVSPDFTSCESKFSDKWADLDAGTCSTTGDAASIKGLVDACYNVVAGTLHPITEMTQTFETVDGTSSTGLSDIGLLGFVNVFDPTGMTYYYGYGVFPAPTTSGFISAIATGEGGPEQGNKQLNIFSDYNNGDHMIGNRIETNVFFERPIVAGDSGRTITFQVDAKLGNLTGASTARFFIKTLDPMMGYATTNFITYNTTTLPMTWGTYEVSIDVTAGLVGQLIQFGFSNTASYYEGSAVFYDNLVISSVPTP